MNELSWQPVVPGLRVGVSDAPRADGREPRRVRLAGELDLATAVPAQRAILDAAAESETVALDLGWVTFFDGFACGRLVEARAAVAARGGQLVVVRAHPAVRRVLRLVGLADLLHEPTDRERDPATPRVVSILDATIDRALRASAADMANAQLVDSAERTLRIVSQRGFTTAFTNFFEVVDGAESACGEAMASGGAVWISDVRTSRLFADTPALEAMLAAKANAVASVPIHRADGELVAMYSVHRRRTGPWSRSDRRHLEALARDAGRALTPA